MLVESNDNNDDKVFQAYFSNHINSKGTHRNQAHVGSLLSILNYTLYIIALLVSQHENIILSLISLKLYHQLLRHFPFEFCQHLLTVHQGKSTLWAHNVYNHNKYIFIFSNLWKKVKNYTFECLIIGTGIKF